MSTNSKPPPRPATPPVGLSSPARPKPPRPAIPPAPAPASPIIKPLQPPARPAVGPVAGPAVGPLQPARSAPPPPARQVPPPPPRPPPTEPPPASAPAVGPAPANNKPTGWWSRFTKKFGFRGKQANITTKTKKNNNKRTWFQKTRSAFVRIPINRALESIYKLGNKLNGSTGDKDIIAELETVIEALRTKLTTLSGSNNTAWGNGIHNDLGTFSRVLELYKTYYVTIQGYTLNLRTLQADLKNVKISGIKIQQLLKQLADKLDGSTGDKNIITELETVIAKLHTKLNTLSSSNNRAWDNGIINDLNKFSSVLKLYKDYYVTIPESTLNLRTLQAELNNVEISGIKTPKLKQLAVTLKYDVTEAVSAVCKDKPDTCTRVVKSSVNKPVIANIPPPSPPFSNPMSARSSSQQSSVSRSHSSANNPAPEPASNSKSRMINNILNNAPRPIKLGLNNQTKTGLRSKLAGMNTTSQPLLTLEPETKAELLERLNNYTSKTNHSNTAKAKLNIRPIIDGIPTKKRGPPVPARRRPSMIPSAFRNP